MIRSVALKFTAFILAAVCLVGTAGSLFGVGFLGYQGLYDRDLETLIGENLERQGETVARHCLMLYTSYTLGHCPQEVLRGGYEEAYSSAQGKWNVIIRQGEETLASLNGDPEQARTYEYTLSVGYLSTEPTENGEEDAVYISDPESGNMNEYLLYQCQSPEYTVTVQISPELVRGRVDEYGLLEQLYTARYRLIVLAAVCLLFFASCVVYLCCVAGRSPGKTEVRPGGLNRLPLDVYIGLLALLGYAVLYFGVELLEETASNSLGKTTLILGIMIASALSLLAVALLFALAAQLKTKGGYWWRNSLIGRCLLLIGRGLRWLCKAVYRLLCLFPVMWRLALIGLGAGLLLFITLIIAMQTSDVLWDLAVFLVPLHYLVLLGYLCYAYGTLFRGVQKMKRGDLTHKIDTRFLFGSFKEFACGLNDISRAAGIAAEKQLRSERMKTELITNVSHDIKTPLTSIINYVDLLQKPHSEEEQLQYLEVLSRQSLRLKKLVDDLMEMSKASTGNITAQLIALDAVEAVTQAMGEFSDKLDCARLTPVLDVPDAPVMMLGDSRLVWRVLSNLLSNAVKYALPDTRLYLSVRQNRDNVLISIKNISKEQLGISAEELMERFVRGDASRNTEGSGLGLNIAKSLMELQKGQLKLLVDGDLFKVTLVFSCP
jgi:signal transduction histidine kinase